MSADQSAGMAPLATSVAAGAADALRESRQSRPVVSRAAQNGKHDPLVQLIISRRFSGHAEFERHAHNIGLAPVVPNSSGEIIDFLFLKEGEAHQPEEVFERLRWGGQVIYVSRDRAAVEAAAATFRTWRTTDDELGAWLIEQPLATEHQYLFNLRFLGWRTPVYFMVARKVMLVPPGKTSERFTYNVYLDKNANTRAYEVVKEVPSFERVLARLREKFPEADHDSLSRRAKKFTDKIFPVFLTRETAILRLLHRDLPKKFRNRVPRVLSAEVDPLGYTRSLRLKWLRNTCPVSPSKVASSVLLRRTPLSQLQFAHQAAELLVALHDTVGVMHLDLRLDNFVITEHGVGFVDFGSAVRIGEEFPEASLLSNLFDEMMRTSQIQRMLGKMTKSGEVTSEEICNSHQRIDKAVDFFYLAVQINNPLANPDFQGLVEYDENSEEARELSRLTAEILRPENPHTPKFTSAQDILRGIEEIQSRLH